MKNQIHHYVPKFLLRKFGSESRKIYVMDKHTGKIFKLSTSKKSELGVAAERGMYDFEFKGAPLTLEPSLAELESDAAIVIDRIVQTEKLDCLDVDGRGTLARFLAVQMVRTRGTWTTHQELAERMEAWLRKERMPEKFFEPDEYVGGGVNAEKASRARMITNAPADYGMSIAEKDWVLLKTKQIAPYMMGDNPLTRHNDFDDSLRGNLGLKSKGIQLYFPLSPTLALAIWCPTLHQALRDYSKRLEALSLESPELVEPHINSWKSSLDTIEAIQKGTPLISIPDNIEHFNSLQVATAERFVFSSNGDFSLVKEMIRNNPELRFGHRLEEATGKF